MDPPLPFFFLGMPKMLMLQGSKDALERFEAAFERIPPGVGAVKHVVQGGGHNPFQAPPAERQAAIERVRQFVHRVRAGRPAVVVMVAGAMGSFSATGLPSALAGLDVEGPVRSLEGRRLGGGNGVTEKVLGAVDAAVRAAAAARPGACVFLAGQSFGARAAVHYAIRRVQRRGPPEAFEPWDGGGEVKLAGLVLCGYPIEHATQDRGAPLEMLRATCCS